MIITTAQCQQNDIVDFGLEKLENTKGKMLHDKVGMSHFHWYLCQLLLSEVCQRSRVDGGSGILEDILEEFQSHLVPLVEEFFEQSANPIYGNQDVSTLANNV